MTRYDKGAAAERELIKMFWASGFAVARVAGSGKNALPMPDLVVLGKGRKIVIECKAWRSNYLSINSGNMQELLKWGEIGEAEVAIAWKYPNKGWFFLKISDFNLAKHYSISFAKAQKVGRPFAVFAGVQSTLKG